MCKLIVWGQDVHSAGEGIILKFLELFARLGASFCGREIRLSDCSGAVLDLTRPTKSLFMHIYLEACGYRGIEGKHIRLVLVRTWKW